MLKPDRTGPYVLIAPPSDVTSEAAAWYATAIDRKEPWLPALLVALQTDGEREITGVCGLRLI